VLGVSTYSLYRESLLGGWFLGARLETDLAPWWWDRLFNQLADGFENLLNVGIMALVLLFEFVRLLGEFPVCAERLPEGPQIAGHKGRYVVLKGEV
jgi:hypothetical protein